jgi:hypothetical protein
MWMMILRTAGPFHLRGGPDPKDSMAVRDSHINHYRKRFSGCCITFISTFGSVALALTVTKKDLSSIAQESAEGFHMDDYDIFICVHG